MTAAAVRQQVIVRDWQYSSGAWLPDYPAFQPYDPTAESRQAYNTRVTDNITACELLARSAGFDATSTRKDEHFTWLALFQVGRMEYIDIKTRCKVRRSVDSIREAVKQTARDVGLTLRAPRRGRPPESEEK